MPKISSLPAGATPDGTETVVADQSAATVTLTVAQIRGTVAPLNASYLTLGANATLSAERVLTEGAGISITDGGSTATIALSSGAINVKDYGATGDGTTDDSAAINAAIAAASALGVSTVYVPSGTYRIAATQVYMKAGICLLGEGTSSIIKQGNSANLNCTVDFTDQLGGFLATGASLRHLVVDGNRDNNTSGLSSGSTTRRIIYYGNTNYVTIDNCTIQNSPGYAIHGASQIGLTVTNNTISNSEAHSVFCVHSAGNFDADCRIMNNTMDNSILVAGINGVIISGNIINGDLIGDVDAPMRVSVSGTAVTWVSGPTFANAKSGMLVIADEGTVQALIKTVNSSTSITLASTAGTHTNKLAMIGTEDLLGVGGCTRCLVDSNIIQDGASFGISLFGTSTKKLEDVMISNNYMYRQGKSALTLLGAGGGAGGLGAQNVTMHGNMVVNCCQGGLAGSAAGGGGLHSYVITEGSIDRIVLNNNYAQDNLALTYTWLSAAGLTAKVILGQGNYQIGAQNDGVYVPAGVVQPLVGTSLQVSTATDADIVTYTGPSGTGTFGFNGGTTYWQANAYHIEIGTSTNHNAGIRTNGTVRLSITGGGDISVRSDIATPAAGSTSARLLFGTTAGFGIYYGSNAPTVSAAQGSIYLRSDGSSTSTRLYVNTNGSTTWTNVVTAA